MRAAEAAGIDRRTHYRWLKDPKYKEQFIETQEQAAQCLEDEAVRRAYEGLERPVTIAGKREIIREYSDTLLIFLLKAARPQKYRDYVRQEHVGPDGTPLNSIPSKIEIVLVPTPKAPEHWGSGETPRALPGPAVPALEGQDPCEQGAPQKPATTAQCPRRVELTLR